VVLFDEQPIKHSLIEVESDLNALLKVWQWFEQFNLPQLPQNLWWQCQVALTEAFTNVVRHAHQNLPQTTPICIEVKIFSSYLEMRIWDRGQPFNLARKLHTLVQQNPNLWNEKGRGLIFMQQFTDEISYLRLSNQQNCLVMRKKFFANG